MYIPGRRLPSAPASRRVSPIYLSIYLSIHPSIHPSNDIYIYIHICVCMYTWTAPAICTRISAGANDMYIGVKS